MWNQATDSRLQLIDDVKSRKDLKTFFVGMVERDGGYSSKTDKECQLAPATGSVLVGSQKETYTCILIQNYGSILTANGDYTDNFGRFGHIFTDVNTSVWAVTETL